MEASEQQQEPLPGRIKDWRALLGPGVVVVDCYALFRTAGWDMQLEKSDEQPDDPHELYLDRVLTVPEGYQPPVVRGIHVHWEEQTDVEYKKVTILPEGPTLDVVDMRDAGQPGA